MKKLAVFEVTKYFVLLALAQEPAHGYAIAKRIVGDSVGGVYLRPSTLYATRKSLERAGFVEECETSGIHAGRRMYQLTDAGRRKLANTAKMQAFAAGLAKTRLGLRY